MRRIGLPVARKRTSAPFALAGIGDPHSQVGLGLDGAAALDDSRDEGHADRRPGCAILPIPGLVRGGTSCPQVGGDSPRDVGSSLEAGAQIARRIASDLRGGRASSYEAWDWENGTTGATISVPLAPTIIEGCGAIDAEADLSVWIADPGEDERRSRALARDGQTYAPHWRRWADQDLGRSID